MLPEPGFLSLALLVAGVVTEFLPGRPSGPSACLRAREGAVMTGEVVAGLAAYSPFILYKIQYVLFFS